LRPPIVPKKFFHYRQTHEHEEESKQVDWSTRSRPDRLLPERDALVGQDEAVIYPST
jgi:hypothetical protein